MRSTCLAERDTLLATDKLAKEAQATHAQFRKTQLSTVLSALKCLPGKLRKREDGLTFLPGMQQADDLLHIQKRQTLWLSNTRFCNPDSPGLLHFQLPTTRLQ